MAMYCLHHDWHLDQTLNKIDGWHYRLVRRAMKVKTTYIDRGKTNKWVTEKSKTTPPSKTITERQLKYFAHVARHPEDIIHKVCYGPPFLPRKLNSTTRRGRPRQHWTPNSELALLSVLRSAEVKVVNRQHLFKICANKKLIFKAVSTHAQPVCDVPHAARRDQTRRSMGARKKKDSFV